MRAAAAASRPGVQPDVVVIAAGERKAAESPSRCVISRSRASVIKANACDPKVSDEMDMADHHLWWMG